MIKEKYHSIKSSEYGSYWNCSKIKKGYSGVAVYTKYLPLNVSYGIGIKEHDLEGRVLTLEYFDFFLIIAYVPNSGPELERLDYRVNHWDKAFSEFIVNLSIKKKVILAGDLNVKHKDPDLLNGKRHMESAGKTLIERENFDKLLKKGFIDSYFIQKTQQEFERFGFDYFIIDIASSNRIISSSILINYEGSDHYPIKLIYKT